MNRLDDTNNTQSTDVLTYDKPKPQKNSNLAQSNFFYGSHWGQCLELLLHLAQYDDHILWVAGPSGIGKTTMLQAMVQTRAAGFNFCVLNGKSETTVETCMQQVASGFGLPWQQNSSMGSEFGELPIYGNETWCLLVDNASLYSIEILKALSNLALNVANNSRPQIHLIFFADSTLEQALKQAKIYNELQDKLHVIDIEPLSLKETCLYLRHKWQEINSDSEFPFSDKILKQIFKLASGNPRSTLKLAKAYLNGENLRQSKWQAILNCFKSPLFMGISVFFIVAFVLVTMLLALDNKNILTDQVTTTAVELPKPKKSEPIISPPVVIEQTNTKIEVVKPDVNIDNKKTVNSKPIVEEAPAEILPQQPTTTVVDLKPLKTEFKETKVIIESLSIDDFIEKHNLDSDADKIDIPKVEIKDTKVISKPETVEKIVTAANKFSLHEQTILSWPKNHYTIQLLGASKSDNMINFIKKYNLATDKAVFYKTTLKGKPWYILIYGHYASMHQAKVAIKELPQNLQQLSPWPRALEIIQQKISNDVKK